jgi:hypothetical protein
MSSGAVGAAADHGLGSGKTTTEPTAISKASPREEMEVAKRLPVGPAGEGRGEVCEQEAGRKKREGRRVIAARSTTFDNTSMVGRGCFNFYGNYSY